MITHILRSKKAKPFWQYLTALCLLVGSGLSVAEGDVKAASAADAKPAKPGPTQVVEDFTNGLLNAVKDNKETSKEDPSEYFAQVQAVMSETVHFKSIAKKIMGETAKKATKEEKIRFLKLTKTKLSETLAKAIANYADSKVQIEKEVPDEKSKRKVYVIQNIQNPAGNIRVVYTMGQWKKAGWKIANLTLGTNNLGEFYKNKFDQGVAISGGDVAKAIDWWVQNG